MAKSTGKPLKILMLHGYTQSGSLFHAKSRALEKHIQKNLPAYSVTLSYPSGPIGLNPADIPNYTPASNGGVSADDKPEAFAWWRRSDVVDPPEYIGMEKGLATVASVLADEGPFDGVIGFSQGACLAAMVASLLEPDRSKAFHYMSDPANNQQELITQISGGNKRDPQKPPQGSDDKKMVTGIPFPSSFANISHPPMKFAICYGGFIAPGTRYRAFYEHPKIQTPVLHVLGTLDMIVEEARSKKLIAACAGNPESDDRVLWHPGGHFLPSQRPYLDGVVQFIRLHIEGLNGNGKKASGDDDVENMDMPF
ncbi:dihydrofolate reductase [Nannizzia gypsea CBS 118893]|uniref:Dihydrofolate reductase n=1 Tax=Arthroderma gypseum (strain ATCC MYA-4604 / CBS 118893) TaxID=535722 RepID=E4UWN7_ARTGP|nr:dihydrofolate reductase [Nannizzia gypsea CBS 118893]EFR02580.1 dihydrofolate reductase [Nannizzia gypsea CBS 118893]